jgi:hypothetical protein
MARYSAACPYLLDDVEVKLLSPKQTSIGLPLNVAVILSRAAEAMLIEPISLQQHKHHVQFSDTAAY